MKSISFTLFASSAAHAVARAASSTIGTTHSAALAAHAGAPDLAAPDLDLALALAILAASFERLSPLSQLVAHVTKCSSSYTSRAQ